MKTILIAICIAFLFIVVGPAHADTVTFNFSGSVTQVSDQVFGDIAFGDAFQGTLSFDSSATDLVPEDPSIGSYAFSSPFGMTLTIGSHDFQATGSLDIEVVNSFVDQYTAFATDQAGGLLMDLFLLDTTGSALGDDHLPLGAPPLASFGERDLHLDDFLCGGEIQLDGAIDVPSTQAIPEPSALIVLVAVSFLIFGLGYRRTAFAEFSPVTPGASIPKAWPSADKPLPDSD